MKKEIKFREWCGRLHKMIARPLGCNSIGYICQRDGNKSTISAVRIRLEYYKGPTLPCSSKTLCVWNATAEDVSAIIGENPEGAHWLLSDNVCINLVVKSKPSGNRRANMIKYPPVNHHTKESK